MPIDNTYDLSAFVPSQQTTNMLAPQTGSLYDPLIQLFGGMARQKREEGAAVAQQAADVAAAEQEQTRYVEGQWKPQGETIIGDKKFAMFVNPVTQEVRKVELGGLSDLDKAKAEKARKGGRGGKPIEVDALQHKRSGESIMGLPEFSAFVQEDLDGKRSLTQDGVNAAMFHANKVVKYRNAEMSEEQALEMANDDVRETAQFTPAVEDTAPWYQGSTAAPATFGQDGGRLQQQQEGTVKVVDPNGKTHIFATQTKANAFKQRAGIK